MIKYLHAGLHKTHHKILRSIYCLTLGIDISARVKSAGPWLLVESLNRRGEGGGTLHVHMMVARYDRDKSDMTHRGQ